MNLKVLAIKKTSEFKIIKNNSKKFHCENLILLKSKTFPRYYKDYPDSKNHFCRVGITVSKVVSKSACARNFVKRRIKNALNQIAPKFGTIQNDYVIIAKKQIIEVNYKKIYNDLEFCFKKLNQS